MDGSSQLHVLARPLFLVSPKLEAFLGFVLEEKLNCSPDPASLLLLPLTTTTTTSYYSQVPQFQHQLLTSKRELPEMSKRYYQATTSFVLNASHLNVDAYVLCINIAYYYWHRQGNPPPQVSAFEHNLSQIHPLIHGVNIDFRRLIQRFIVLSLPRLEKGSKTVSPDLKSATHALLLILIHIITRKTFSASEVVYSSVVSN